MSISGSNSDVNVANMDEQKREPILTAKALINKMEKLHKERQAKVHKMKSVIKTMKDLMQRDDNASQIRTQLEHLMQLVKETTLLHTSVIPLLPTDEQEKQNVWFAKTLEYNNGFIDDVKQWLSETGRQPSSTIAHVPSIEISDEHQQSESYVSKQSEKNVETSEAQDEIKPSDSVSNVGSIRSGKRSSAGIRSSVSITSSCIRAEADMAALMARQMLLKDKHALDEQEEELRNTKEELRKKEEQLRKKREQLEMEVEIAASRAKMNVLMRSGRSRAASNTSVSPNGINSYLERGRKEATLSAGAKTFVPGTNRPTGGGQQLQSDGQFLHREPEAKYGHLQHQATRSSEASVHHSSTQLHPQLQQQSNHPAALAPSSSAQNSLMNVLERQNEITAMLVQQQSLSFLPKREIQIFDGSPFQYQAFIRAFEHCIEEKTNNPKDCLYFLEQYTRGQPLELVRSCQHMAHDRGYAKAKALLQEHFGNAQKIVSAYMEKALSWQPIKVEDVRALQAYGLFLRGCCNVMEDFEYMCELNMPSNMLAIIKKLPYKYRDKWRTLAYDLQKRQGQRATFMDIVSFIERQVEIVSDPLFGDIQDTPPAANKDVRKATFEPYSRMRGSSFATTVTTAENTVEPERMKERDSLDTSVCLFCGGGHKLNLCFQLERKAHGEKIAFLREHGLCFGCLCIGHMSKDCRKRLSCKVCSLRHPSTLHIYQREEETDTMQAKGKAISSALISVQSSGLTGAGEPDCTLSIVPVQVKSKKGHQTFLTYAFLDPGSSASFCTERLMNKLNLRGRRTDILLRTMGQEKIVGSHIVSDLHVAGLDSSHYFELPNTYTQKTMPVHRGNIPLQKDLQRWPHLKHVTITEIDSDVDLLIGTNVPEALEPWEVIRSVDGGPYAVKTMLGWTVNGPLRGDGSREVTCGQPDVTVNRISVANLEEQKQQDKQHREDRRSSRHSDRKNNWYLRESKDRSRSRSRDREPNSSRNRSRDKDREHKNRSEETDSRDTETHEQGRKRLRSTSRERKKRSTEKSPKKPDTIEETKTRRRHKQSKKSKKKSKKKHKKKSHLPEGVTSSGESEKEKESEDERVEGLPAASPSGGGYETEAGQKNHDFDKSPGEARELCPEGKNEQSITEMLSEAAGEGDTSNS